MLKIVSDLRVWVRNGTCSNAIEFCQAAMDEVFFFCSIGDVLWFLYLQASLAHSEMAKTWLKVEGKMPKC